MRNQQVMETLRQLHRGPKRARLQERRLATPRGAKAGDVLEKLETGDVYLAINVDCDWAQFDALGPAWGAIVVMLW